MRMISGSSISKRRGSPGAGGCARSDPRFVGGSREDYEQKPDHGYADAVIDPLGLADHEALAGIGEKAGALSDKAQSRDQGENSDGSQ